MFETTNCALSRLYTRITAPFPWHDHSVSLFPANQVRDYFKWRGTEPGFIFQRQPVAVHTFPRARDLRSPHLVAALYLSSATVFSAAAVHLSSAAVFSTVSGPR